MENDLANGIVKRFGEDFFSRGSALTLNPLEVSDEKERIGTYTKTHADGWTITGKINEDHYYWVNEFKAIHPTFGVVEGDFELEVRGTSEEAFAHFLEHHAPEEWDYEDI